MSKNFNSVAEINANTRKESLKELEASIKRQVKVISGAFQNRLQLERTKSELAGLAFDEVTFWQDDKISHEIVMGAIETPDGDKVKKDGTARMKTDRLMKQWLVAAKLFQYGIRTSEAIALIIQRRGLDNLTALTRDAFGYDAVLKRANQYGRAGLANFKKDRWTIYNRIAALFSEDKSVAVAIRATVEHIAGRTLTDAEFTAVQTAVDQYLAEAAKARLDESVKEPDKLTWAAILPVKSNAANV
jgi:hypothetical protein